MLQKPTTFTSTSSYPSAQNPLDFIDLKTQQARIRPQVDKAIQGVLNHGQYIMGPEVEQLEKELAQFCGARYAISCANGTDALALGLMAKGVRPGDAIFVPSFTFSATAEVVSWMGATIVFVDSLPDTFNMDPECLAQAIRFSEKAGFRPKGVIPVDLFGQPAEYDVLEAIAEDHNLWVMADGAQSFGAYYRERRVGSIGHLSTTSFFPAKPLGCYGDGGAIFTDDEDLMLTLKSLRVHGQGKDKYDNVRVGMNGRLDTLQAAILIEKLKIFEDEILNRQRIADRYHKGLSERLRKPILLPHVTSVWAQYTLVLPEEINRQHFMETLKQQGIPTFIYYAKPLHQQQAYQGELTGTGTNLPICEKLAQRVVSLPMHAYLEESVQDYIIDHVNKALK
jgi:dTDP-4-amino-4,6-dideoxygalactose transaminase